MRLQIYDDQNETEATFGIEPNNNVSIDIEGTKVEVAPKDWEKINKFIVERVDERQMELKKQRNWLRRFFEV